jgi:signal transduction histidine kinase
MLDRLGAVGGRISIRSAPGRGTDVDGAVTVST